jgi:hypothetical protein
MSISLAERKANYEKRLSMKRRWYKKNKGEISDYNKQYYKENIRLPKSIRKSLSRTSKRKHSRRGSRRRSKSRRRMLRHKEEEIDAMIQRLVNIKAQLKRQRNLH